MNTLRRNALGICLGSTLAISSAPAAAQDYTEDPENTSESQPSPAPSDVPSAEAPAPAEAAAPAAQPTDAAPADDYVGIELTEEELAQLEALENEFTPEEGLEQYAAVATKFVEPTSVTPASVSVISKEQLIRGGYRSVGEALGSVPGVFVTYDMVNYHVAMRGALGGARAGSRYLKIMVDGVQVPFAQSETYFLGPEFIPMSAIERIEVLRGPASALYGTGALVGAINIVTKREAYAGSIAVNGDIRANVGAVGVYGGGVDASVSVTGQNFFVLAGLAGAFENRSGYQLTYTAVTRQGPLAEPFERIPSQFSGPAYGFVDENQNPLASKDDIALPATAFVKGELNLLGGVLKGFGLTQLHFRDAEFHDLSVFTEGNTIQILNSKGGLSYERSFLGGFTATGRVSMGGGVTLPNDQIKLQPADPFIIQRRSGDFVTEASGTVRYDFENGGFVLGGIDGWYDYERLPQYIEVDIETGEPTERNALNEQHLVDVGAYAQVVYPLFDLVRLAGGARVDFHNVYMVTGAARLGGVLTLSKQFALKALFGTAHKGPSPEQLFTTPIDPNARDISGIYQEGVIPAAQYLFGGELSLDYYPFEWLYLSAAGFTNYYWNALAYVLVGTQLVATQYNAFGGGGELQSRAAYTFDDLGLTLEGGVTLSAQYTSVIQDTIGGVTQKALPDNEGVPVAVVNSQFGVRMDKIFSRMFVEYRWVSPRTPSQSNLLEIGSNPNMLEPNYMLSDYHLINLVLSTTPINIADLMSITGSFRVTNALGLPLPLGEDGAWQPLVSYSEIGFNGVDIPAQMTTFWGQVQLQF